MLIPARINDSKPRRRPHLGFVPPARSSPISSFQESSRVLGFANFFASEGDLFCCIACIDDKATVLHDETLIIGRMIGRNDGTILRGKKFGRQFLALHGWQIWVVPHFWQYGNMGIVVAQNCAAIEQQLHQ